MSHKSREGYVASIIKYIVKWYYLNEQLAHMSPDNLVNLIPWLADLLQRPKLKISECYARNWQLQTGIIWRFANLEVTNLKGQTAQRCDAVAEIIDHPSGVNLHQRIFGLHWADVPYSYLSTSAEPVDIGGAPHRLDVAYTYPNINGALMAIPIALSTQQRATQAHLPPGDYILSIRVRCGNGRGDAKKFKLISPTNWQDLDIHPV